MAGRMAQLSLFLVALTIGVLLVGQLRSQAPRLELSSLSPQELSGLIQTLQTTNVELADGLVDLREQIGEYERAEIEGQSTLTIGVEDLLRIRAFGGLIPVRGQGIVMEVEGSFEPSAVNDLIYELRNAAAEAIAVDDIRITARSVAVLGAGTIEIDGESIGRSFTISAIGSPSGLKAALDRPGGIVDFLEQFIPDSRFIINERRDLVVPETQRDLTPAAAVAVE